MSFPIWRGIAAWPVNDFVKNNDFTGKTVIPFCASASSGLGQSGALLAEIAGTGDWLTGTRFSSGASRGQVAEWAIGLGAGTAAEGWIEDAVNFWDGSSRDVPAGA